MREWALIGREKAKQGTQERQGKTGGRQRTRTPFEAARKELGVGGRRRADDVAGREREREGREEESVCVGSAFESAARGFLSVSSVPVRAYEVALSASDAQVKNLFSSSDGQAKALTAKRTEFRRTR